MSETFTPDEQVCPSCGGSITADARFCKYCAFNLATSPPPEAQASLPANRSSRRRFIWLVGGLAAVLVITVIAVALYKNRHITTSAAISPSQVMSEKARQVEARILQGATVTNADLAGLSSYELRVLRNVHFARYGRGYERPGLGDYFFTRPWYKPSNNYNDKLLTTTDKANISLILIEENKAKATESASAANMPTSSPLDTRSTSIGSSSNSELSSAVIQSAISAATQSVLRQTEMGSSWRTVQVKSSSVQILRQGNYNEAQKYWPVQATVSGTSRREPEFYMGNSKPSENCQFSFFLEYAIKKNDYGDWIAIPPPFFTGPINAKCGK